MFMETNTKASSFQNTEISVRGISANKLSMWPPHITTSGKKLFSKIF